MQKALNTYASEVREGAFPASEHSFAMPQDLVEQLAAELREDGILY
jgi:hypothetical protein